MDRNGAADVFPAMHVCCACNAVTATAAGSGRAAQRADVLQRQLENQFKTKVLMMPPGEVCFVLTLPAAHNIPVRVNWHNMTKEQTVAMVEALYNTFPYPQRRLKEWVAKTAGGVQKRTQRPARQQRKVQQAHMEEQQGEIVCAQITGFRSALRQQQQCLAVLWLLLSVHHAQPAVHYPSGTLCVAGAA